MATDLNERYNDLISDLGGIDTLNEINSATPQLTNQQQSSLEEISCISILNLGIL